MSQSSPRRYLVCASNNSASRATLKLACVKAKHHGGSVTVAHAIPPADMQTLFTVADRLKNEQRAEAEKFLSEMCEEAFALTGLMPDISILEGKIGEEIISTAMEDKDIMLLMIGLAEDSGRGKLVEWLSSQIGKKLLVPMMVVPGNLTDEQIQRII